MSDAIVLGTATAVSALVILYIVWSNRHYSQESDRKRDQQNLLLQIQRELDQQHTAIRIAACNCSASWMTITAS